MADESPLARHEEVHLAVARRTGMQPAASDLIRVGSRRWFLQTGLSGLAGLSLPGLLHFQAQGITADGASRKAVILIWLSGGPSHLDTWDPKPDAPAEVCALSVHRYEGPWCSRL